MESERGLRILFTGGGTGGHLFPAVATAEAFKNKHPSTSVFFIGTRRGVDERTLAAHGFTFQNICCYGLKGKNFRELLKAVSVLPFSYLQAMIIIRRFRPDLIVGVGGYVTGPVVVAAKTLGVPAVIHEQNVIPGLANRKLSKIVDRICLSLPGSEKWFSEKKCVFTGNPVRRSILNLASKGLSPTSTKKTVLILGGSQGAMGVNRMVTAAFTSLSEQALSGLKVIHQTGEKDVKMVEEVYLQNKIEARVQSFFVDMDRIYREADLVVSRAGATTLSELAVLGKPAILIPYPHAADNHQKKNSDYYVEGGGAIVILEKSGNGAMLAEKIYELIGDDATLKKMGRAMEKMSFPDAADRIVNCCLEIVNYGY